MAYAKGEKIKLLLCAMLLLAGCTQKTEFGQCIGLTDREEANLIYRPSAKNISLGLIFFWLIAPPVYVAVEEFSCPIGVKK